MKKSDRIATFVDSLGLEGEESWDPRYLGYFHCFNARDYYEAHDVLEDLWLREGRASPDYGFYKGLIQLAGGFVHLKLQHTHPEHPKHGRRLAPARRLLLLAEANLLPYRKDGTDSRRGYHHGLDLEAPLSIARAFVARLNPELGNTNPWHPDHAPHLPIPGNRGDL